MTGDKARIAVVGYGVIGRRVADAVRLQDDMQIEGIAGRPTSLSLRDAQLRGYNVFLTDKSSPGDPAGRLFTPCGQLEDLLPGCDAVLDCTPSGTPCRHAGLYERHGQLAVIVQGGEKHAFAGTSFNAMANYREAIGRKRVRVISCSSTGTARFVFAIDRAFGLEQALVMLVRRAADPAKPARNPINALTPVMGQSHHGPDVNTVLPQLRLFSMSVDASTSFAHVVNFQVDLRRRATREQVLEVLERTPRVIVGGGLRTTADVAEHFRDLGRSRGDRPEIYVWKEGIRVEGRTVFATISVHMESITIPETVDCVRAALNLEPDPWASIYRTDLALGIAKSEECYRP